MPLAEYPARPTQGQTPWFAARENYDEALEANISEAYTTATSAESVATNAASNAASALSTAQSAQTTADAAQTDASSAMSAAGNAQTTANAAQSAAEAAQIAADNSVQTDNLRLPILLTQAEYDALNPPVAGQIYIIRAAEV